MHRNIQREKRRRRRRRRRKREESSKCAYTTHTWKPLVERGMPIETNKHIYTPFMFISSETRQAKQKWKTEVIEPEKKFSSSTNK
jgi:hypothetical protein